MNPISRRNALLENDDEERDLDALTRFKEEESSKIAKKADENPPQAKIENIDGEEKKEEETIKEEICEEKAEEEEEEKTTNLQPEKQSAEEEKYISQIPIPNKNE